MATEVAARLDGLPPTKARLRCSRAAWRHVTDHGPALRRWGSPALPDTPSSTDAVVNCTGPMTDVSRSTDPLLRALRRAGAWSSPTRSSWGVAVHTRRARCSTSPRQVVPGLYVVGPPRKGTLWETTAVPEIRGQAAALAQRLPERVRGEARRPESGVG